MAGAAHVAGLIIDSGAGTDDQGALFSVDISNGTRTLINDFGNAAQAPLAVIPFGLKMNGSGEVLVVDEDAGPDFSGALFRIDPISGNRSLISDFNNSAQGPLGEYPAALTTTGEILVAILPPAPICKDRSSR